MTITPVRWRRNEVRFDLDGPPDVVQKHLSRGKFYAQEQLERHLEVIVPRRTVIDIGANVGNHTVFYAAFSRADRVVAFEPNPPVRAMLARNVALNGLGNVVLEHARHGLGRVRGRGTVVAPAANLSAGRVVAAEGADGFEVRPLDDFAFENVAFVKIDVEGMELDVLAGAAETLRRNRPVLAVEVDPKNNAGFFEWCASAGYHVVAAWRQHNPFDYLCVPMF